MRNEDREMRVCELREFGHQAMAVSDNIAVVQSPCNLQFMSLRWLISVALSISSPVLAADQNLCGTLENLKREAVLSGPQRIAIFKEESMAFACGRAAEVQAQDGFCNAAAGPVGLEFTHVFPWLIYDCLRNQRIKPEVDIVDQYTGIQRRQKIVHLWAGWPDGTRIDIRFRPSGDFSPQAKFKDYWGAYELVIWRPNSTP